MDGVDGKRDDREAADAGDGEGNMAEQDRLDRRLDRSRCAGCKWVEDGRPCFCLL